MFNVFYHYYFSYVYVTVADGHVIMPRGGPKATTVM